jgi:hypothetical protein
MEELNLDDPKLKEIKNLPIPWHHRLALRFSHRLFFRLVMGDIGLENKLIDCSFELFENKRIDIFPLGASSRGFLLVIDNKFSMWFYQKNDHFVYDGLEIGEYENGEVVIFDELK